MTTW
jgi:solute carrier family 25 oxoglutarate transporter 11